MHFLLHKQVVVVVETHQIGNKVKDALEQTGLEVDQVLQFDEHLHHDKVCVDQRLHGLD